MRPIEELSGEELTFLRDAWEAYPGALGYTPDKADQLDTIAGVLVDEGYLERVELTGRHVAQGDELVQTHRPIRSVSYRLRPEWAVQFKAIVDNIASSH
jgi:hypothetical protein